MFFNIRFYLERVNSIKQNTILVVIIFYTPQVLETRYGNQILASMASS